jgi:hypothetical protein
MGMSVVRKESQTREVRKTYREKMEANVYVFQGE